MDIRTTRGPVGHVVAGLDAFNGRHPWSHNDHFHGWILRNLPTHRGSALDVGCGRGGLLAELAPRFLHVDGVDVDAQMARLAAARFGNDRHITVRCTPFDHVSGRYDLITMVAVLHHLDLEAALRHARDLLVPSGTLLVVGLARPVTAHDLMWDLASAALNPAVGLLKHPRATTPRAEAPYPVADPTMTFDEITATGAHVLPGARLQRRLFFRYTLTWTKP